MVCSVRHDDTSSNVVDTVPLESTRERVVKVCRAKCRRCKGAGSTCAKVLLVLVNFSFLVSGVALVLIGVWLHIYRDSLLYTHLMRVVPRNIAITPVTSRPAGPWAAAASSTPVTSSGLPADVISVDGSPFVLIAAGTCVTVVGFLGCCGACAESVCFLGFYSVLTVFIIVAEVVIIAVSSGIRHDLSERLLENLQHQVQFYYNATAQRFNSTNADTINKITLAWNAIQTYLNCCGAVGPQDYMSSAWYNHTKDYSGEFVPATCCQLVEPDPIRPNVRNAVLCHAEGIIYHNTQQPITELHTRGCHEALIRWIEGYEHLVVSLLCVLVILQVLNVVFACLLINWIRKKHSDYTWCDVEEFM